IGFAVVGAYEDASAKQRTKDTLSTRVVVESILAAAGCLAIIRLAGRTLAPSPELPVTAGFAVEQAWMFVAFGAGVVVAAGHVFSLADKHSRHALGPMVLTTACLALTAYLAGNRFYADYLGIRYVADGGEIAVLCGAATGAGLGLIWQRAARAPMVIGRSASLALGGMLGMTAIAIKHEVILAALGSLVVQRAG